MLDRLISENRPAGKMREVGEREGGMRRVWASGKKREGGKEVSEAKGGGVRGGTT